jgi:hypothetical protein
MRNSLKLIAVFAMAAAFSCGAPGVPGGAGMPGGGGGGASGSSSVDPNACAGIQEIDIGRRIHAFLVATANLQEAVFGIESYVKDTCADMGRRLGMSVPSGNTSEVCNAVANELRASLQAGFKAQARLNVDYQPAVCEVNAEFAAKAAAECEAKAEADIRVSCEGTCQGTCSGACEGKCAGAAGGGGAAGQCNGECQGTCKGECKGECRGTADVQAEATCEASAEVRANAQVECTEPELKVTYDAKLVADTAKLEAAIDAVKYGLPRLLVAHAKITGPVKRAVTIWARTAKDLKKSAGRSATALGVHFACVTGQLAAAVSAVAEVNVSVSVSVEASASVGGAAGAGM